MFTSRTLSLERYVGKPAGYRVQERDIWRIRDTHRDEKREREREEAGFRTEIREEGEGGVGSALRDDLAGARGKSRPGMHGERERRLAAPTRSRGVANSVARKLARERERERGIPVTRI